VARHSASDTISIFEASLLWFDKDPSEQLLDYSYGCGWIVLLTRDQEVHDLALALLSEVAEGSIRAKTKSWLPHYIPKDWKDRLNSPGGLDPRGTNITISDLLKFANDRGQTLNFLAHLTAEPPTQTVEASEATSEGPPKGRQKRRSRKHGPKRGSVGYSQADVGLYSKIKRLIPKYGSAYAAALSLVHEGKVTGRGSAESRAKRLAARYLRDQDRRNR
jgi:hypothetical protein